jgi:hypothetical protein
MKQVKQIVLGLVSIAVVFAVLALILNYAQGTL